MYLFSTYIQQSEYEDSSDEEDMETDGTNDNLRVDEWVLVAFVGGAWYPEKMTNIV